MRARSLVAFTVLGQMAVGMFWALAAVGWNRPHGSVAVRGPLLVVGVLLAAAGASALLHLGTPAHARRALANLRGSWLSREVALTGVFAVGWAVVAWTGDGSSQGAAGPVTLLTALAGAALVYAMARVYRLRTVPSWDTRLTTASFFLTAASSGALAAAAALGVATGSGADGVAEAAIRALVAAGVLSLALELAVEIGGWGVRREAAAAVDAGLNPQAGADPVAFWRVALLVGAVLAGAVAWLGAAPGAPAAAMGVGLTLAFALATTAALVGRGRFYAGHARRGL